MIGTWRRHEALFQWEQLPGHLQAVSRPIGELAKELAITLPDGHMLDQALLKLWEAKNAAVVHAGFMQEKGAGW